MMDLRCIGTAAHSLHDRRVRSRALACIRSRPTTRSEVRFHRRLAAAARDMDIDVIGNNPEEV